MKYLKLFENFDRGTLADICEEHGIENYTINDDGTVDVDGVVDFRDLLIDKIPLKFGKVSGNFLITTTNIKSLENSPREVGGNFHAESLGLVSLIGGPVSVGGIYNVYDNKITSLEGSPKIVDDFDIRCNRIVSLEHSPEYVSGNFYCGNNKLTSLVGSPKKVMKKFDCSFSSITSLMGAPEYIGEYLNCCDTKVSSLNGLNSYMGGGLLAKEDIILIYDILKDNLDDISNFYDFGIITDLNEYKKTLNLKRLEKFIELYDLKPLDEKQLYYLKNYYNVI